MTIRGYEDFQSYFVSFNISFNGLSQWLSEVIVIIDPKTNPRHVLKIISVKNQTKQNNLNKSP